MLPEPVAVLEITKPLPQPLTILGAIPVEVSKDAALDIGDHATLNPGIICMGVVSVIANEVGPFGNQNFKTSWAWDLAKLEIPVQIWIVVVAVVELRSGGPRRQQTLSVLVRQLRVGASLVLWQGDHECGNGPWHYRPDELPHALWRGSS